MKHTKKRIPDVEKIPATAVKAFIKTVWSIWVKFENEYLAPEKSKDNPKKQLKPQPAETRIFIDLKQNKNPGLIPVSEFKLRNSCR